MSSFAISIALLSLVQAALIAVPARVDVRLPVWMRSRWSAAILPGSILVVIGGIALTPGLAGLLADLALVAVPPLAAVALARFVPGARPALAPAVVPLFLLAWLAAGTPAGEVGALSLSALACVSLSVALVALAPAGWVRIGVYGMAVVDAVLVGADLLQQPNSVLANATPGAGLPQLQSVLLGHAVMGFGDLFVATTVGALLASQRIARGPVVLIAAVLGLGFDLLFFAVNELPATVPIAGALALATAGVSGTRVRTAPSG